MSSQNNNNNSSFLLVKELNIHGVPHLLYRSSASGLRVALSKVQSPMVEGAFVLATEAHDNDGCPHTLEHLVFLGSEIYPYKGVLDGLANRCLAQGTNAWTDTDHTAYTLSTAGQEGFLNLLPIYLDHILYCNIQDSGFVTEVHHINGEGENAGVVYCEMQGRQNSASDLVYRKMLYSMWGDPAQCGYSAETGGKMENLRSLTVETVRNYHKSFYRPDNLYMLISGQVDEKNLIAVLEKFEKERILKKPSLQPMKRPWVDSFCPDFPATRLEKVNFPADDESSGFTFAGWRTTKYTDFLTTTALDILWLYLTDSAISPLSQALVEIKEPYCTAVSFGMIGGTQNLHYLRFSDVDTKKQGQVRDVFLNTLNSLVQSGIDMTRMKDLISRNVVKIFSSLETNPHQWQGGFISHFLYGDSNEQLESALNEVPALQELLKKDNQFWIALLKKWIIEHPYAWVEGSPSIELGKKLAEDEKLRLQKQRQELGEKRLEQLAKELQDAIQNNQKPIPPEIFSSLPIPDAGKIPFIPVSVVRNGKGVDSQPATQKVLEKLNQDSAKPFAYFAEFSHVPSNFVTLNFHVDTSKTLSTALRPYLELWFDVMFKLPIQRGNQLISHDEVVASLDRETVSYSNEIGFGGSSDFSCGSFGQIGIVSIQVEISKYSQGIAWLHDVLFNSQFDPKYLKISATKLLNSIPAIKRRGDRMNYCTSESNHNATSIFVQEPFLNQVMKRLSDPETEKQVISELEQMRKALLNPKHMYMQVVSDMHKLEKPKSALEALVPASVVETCGPASNLDTLKPVAYSSALQTKPSASQIFGIGSIENSYLYQVSQSISSYDDKDIPALMVLNEYLSGMEGPFWNEIRGVGLAYGYGLYLRVEEGFLIFTLSKSSNVFDAYERAKEIVTKIDFDDLRVEAARSSCIFEVVSREEDLHSAALQQLLMHFKGLPSTSNKDLLQQIQTVSKTDLQRVMSAHVLPLFQNKQGIFVTTNPSKVPEICEAFEKTGTKIITFGEPNKNE